GFTQGQPRPLSFPSLILAASGGSHLREPLRPPSAESLKVVGDAQPQALRQVRTGKQLLGERDRSMEVARHSPRAHRADAMHPGLLKQPFRFTDVGKPLLDLRGLDQLDGGLLVPLIALQELSLDEEVGLSYFLRLESGIQTLAADAPSRFVWHVLPST